MSGTYEERKKKYLEIRSTSIPKLSIAARTIQELDVTGADANQPYVAANEGDYQSLEQVLDQYRFLTNYQTREAFHYDSFGLVFDTAMLVSPSAVGSATASAGAFAELAGAAASSAAEIAVGAGLDELKNHGLQQISLFLENKLKELAINGVFVPTPLDQSPENRLDWLMKNGAIDQLLSAEVAEEDQVAIQGMAISVLDDIVKKGINVQDEINDQVRDEMSKQAGQIQKVTRTLNQFQEETQDHISKIVKSQDAIRRGLKNLSEQTGENTKDISFIKRYLFDRMTPQEQLDALEKGAGPTMSEEKKHSLLRNESLLSNAKR